VNARDRPEIERPTIAEDQSAGWAAEEQGT